MLLKGFLKGLLKGILKGILEGICKGSIMGVMELSKHSYKYLKWGYKQLYV